jgi:hypothetical protein
MRYSTPWIYFAIHQRPTDTGEYLNGRRKLNIVRFEYMECPVATAVWAYCTAYARFGVVLGPGRRDRLVFGRDK